ncbi:Gfo/Idh/MocA family oxidoreductase, partial [Flavobacteriaceae bacterium]|nr:Gfo/Idh/MocA family oxidoreductase [Flavobacteriaceae bacterium]
MIKVAIIGAGYMANEHIKAFSSLENVMVNGIFSRTKEKAIIISKKYKIEFVAESINELYNLTKADVVVNTSSVASILDTTKKCLNFPWINLVEKPPGYNLNEALTLYELVEKKNAQLYVALNRRHYSSVKKALFELKNDDSKRVVKVLDQEDQNDPKRIGHSNKIIQNWMFANSIHLIDY